MNTKVGISGRLASGRLTWAGPLWMTFARPLFLITSQTLAAVFLLLAGSSHPFQASAQWWTVWASLADLACLAALARLTRREGLRLRDLLGLGAQRPSRDILLGIGLFVVLLPVVAVGGIILGDLLVYGTWWPSGAPPGVVGRLLPLWAVVYTRVIWWPLWSLVEQLTFNGYALPRLEVLFGRSWPAVALVTFGWCLQHAFLPFVFDGRYLLLRFITFLPFNLVTVLLYLRLRRLAPLVVAHWGLDLVSTLFTLA